MKHLLNFLIGCQHENCGWPITRTGLTVRVCLECGKARKYDMKRMKFVAFERGEERKLQTPHFGQGVIT